MATKTHLWKHVPVELLSDDTLLDLFRKCWCVVLYWKIYRRDIGKKNYYYLRYHYGISIKKEVAEKFIPIFQEEINKRGKRWVAPTRETLFKYLRRFADKYYDSQETFKKILNGTNRLHSDLP